MRYRILSHDTGMNGQKFAEICKFIVSVLLSAGKTLHAISAPVADVVRRVDFSPYKCEHTQCLATHKSISEHKQTGNMLPDRCNLYTVVMTRIWIFHVSSWAVHGPLAQVWKVWFLLKSDVLWTFDRKAFDSDILTLWRITSIISDPRRWWMGYCWSHWFGIVHFVGFVEWGNEMNMVQW